MMNGPNWGRPKQRVPRKMRAQPKYGCVSRIWDSSFVLSTWGLLWQSPFLPTIHTLPSNPLFLRHVSLPTRFHFLTPSHNKHRYFYSPYFSSPQKNMLNWHLNCWIQQIYYLKNQPKEKACASLIKAFHFIIHVIKCLLLVKQIYFLLPRE